MAYNGYKNWETWNVALWLANDEPLYKAARSMMAQAAKERRGQRMNAKDAESLTRALLPNGTPDFDTPDEYGAVDWNEIREFYMDLVGVTD
jgi:hypothetical protein